MRVHVTGVHRDTTTNVELMLEAESDAAATEILHNMNILVEKLEPAREALAAADYRYEYHTMRCNFADLNEHLNKFSEDWWRVVNLHHDPNDDKMVRVLLERIHRIDTAAKY